MKLQYLFFLLPFFLFLGCTTDQIDSQKQIISEAKSFFESYADDLSAKNVEGIVTRYHKSGVYFLGNGQKKFSSYDSIKARYQEKWIGPESFQWQDLSFEEISEDAVLVMGKFNWTTNSSEEPLSFSYSGLLIRQDGELRIRLEDESVDPMSMKDIICPPDSISNQ